MWSILQWEVLTVNLLQRDNWRDNRNWENGEVKSHVKIYPERTVTPLVWRKQNEAFSKTNTIISDPGIFHLPLIFFLFAAQFLTVFWDCKHHFSNVVHTSDISLTEKSVTTLNCSNLHSKWSVKYQSNSPWMCFSVNYFLYLIVFCIPGKKPANSSRINENEKSLWESWGLLNYCMFSMRHS